VSLSQVHTATALASSTTFTVIVGLIHSQVLHRGQDIRLVAGMVALEQLHYPQVKAQLPVLPIPKPHNKPNPRLHRVEQLQSGDSAAVLGIMGQRNVRRGVAVSQSTHITLNACKSNIRVLLGAPGGLLSYGFAITGARADHELTFEGSRRCIGGWDMLYTGYI